MAMAEGSLSRTDNLRGDADLLSSVAAYRAPDNLPAELADFPILLLVGPSGAGKDSVKRTLLQTGRYYELVSHTTRRPRINDGTLEVDGHDYHFVSFERMAQMVRGRQFIQVKRYGSNYYGTSIAELTRATAYNSTAVTDVNVDGATEFANLRLSHLSTVFLLPPSFGEWLQRLRHRQSSAHTEEDAYVAQRLAIAINELKYAIRNAGQMAILINDNLSALCRKIDYDMVHDRRVSSMEGNVAVVKRLLLETKRYLKDLDS